VTAALEEEQLNRAAGSPIPLCRPFARRHVGGVGDILYNWRIAVLFAHQFRTCEVLVEFAALRHCGIVGPMLRWPSGARRSALTVRFIPWRQAVSAPATQNPILGESRQECLRQ
jgi:hypothetical protein